MKSVVENMLLKKIIKSALQEDIGEGDITTKLIIPKNDKGNGFILAKEPGVLAGAKIVEQTFKLLDPGLKFNHIVKDGEKFKSGAMICKFEANLSAILTAERTALNFLAKLSGIATLTNKFVEGVSASGGSHLPKVKILDTRKTTPNLRELEKYAVRCGGGYNHRMGLWDMILIKDNHILAAGGIRKALARCQMSDVRCQVEIEVKDLKELEEALVFATGKSLPQYSIDRVMLDNMSIREIREAVSRCRGQGAGCKIEVSGGVNLENVSEIAETGVDYISVGELTHSAPAIDFSLELLRN